MRTNDRLRVFLLWREYASHHDTRIARHCLALCSPALPSFLTLQLTLYHRLRQTSFDFQKEAIRVEHALKGYLTLLRRSLQKALAQYLLDFTEDAKHATVDWWNNNLHPCALIRQDAKLNNI